MKRPPLDAPAASPLQGASPHHSSASLARRLRLQQLLVFTKVVQAGSILAASRELAMTQPAVSKSVHELETQLGGALFVRGKRGVALTEFGRLFERHAKTLIADLRYLAEDLNASQSGSAGHVIVGTLITASATLLPDAIKQLRRIAPDVAVTVRVGPNSMLFPALARGELDLVVGVLPAGGDSVSAAQDLQLVHAPLYREALRVVVGRDHTLARRRKVALTELRDFEWIVPTPESAAYPSVRAFFAQAGLMLPARVVESVSILTNLGLLTGSSMVALMPQSAAEHFAQAGWLAILPVQGLGSFGAVGYTLCANREPTAATRRFLLALREAAVRR
ncbi:MAG: LysR family transcriptional regulator [Burkholderiaceae bacterium]|nr:LysR family transcriptional regulator [Burkholderiaceae bacterium]